MNVTPLQSAMVSRVSRHLRGGSCRLFCAFRRDDTARGIFLKEIGKGRIRQQQIEHRALEALEPVDLLSLILRGLFKYFHWLRRF